MEGRRAEAGTRLPRVHSRRVAVAHVGKLLTVYNGGEACRLAGTIRAADATSASDMAGLQGAIRGHFGWLTELSHLQIDFANLLGEFLMIRGRVTVYMISNCAEFASIHSVAYTYAVNIPHRTSMVLPRLEFVVGVSKHSIRRGFGSCEAEALGQSLTQARSRKQAGLARTACRGTSPTAC